SDRVIDKVHMIQQLKNLNQYGVNAEFLVNSFDHQHWFVKEKIMENCLLMNDSLQSVLIEKAMPLLSSSYAAERNNALSALQKMKYSHLMEIVKEKLESETSWMVKGNCLRILKDSLGQKSY